MFERLVTRVNTAVIGLLSDGVMVFGAHQGRVLFDREYSNVSGVASTDPVVSLSLESFPGLSKGSAVTINGAPFVVVSKPEADGKGMARVQLQVSS
jgi:hypothetical protein